MVIYVCQNMANIGFRYEIVPFYYLQQCNMAHSTWDIYVLFAYINLIFKSTFACEFIVCTKNLSWMCTSEYL